MRNGIITFNVLDILISDHSRIMILKYCDIVAITTDMPYIVIHTKNNSKGIFINATLHGIIEQLPCVFFLINQSAIINLFYLKTYTQRDSEYLLYLDNGQKYTVARRKKREFKERLLYLKKNCMLDCEYRVSCNGVCSEKRILSDMKSE